MKFKNIKEKPNTFTTKFTGILETSDGSKSLPYINHREHYKDGMFRRINGPAVEYCALHNPRSGYPDGTRKWCIEGKLHNEKGPAIVCGKVDQKNGIFLDLNTIMENG
jgi:hypothetical protein